MVSSCGERQGFRLFSSWLVFCWAYLPQFVQRLVCWWEWRLFLCLSCCDNATTNTGAFYLFKLVFSYSLEKYLRVELLERMAFLFLVFVKTLHTICHKHCQFTFLPTVCKDSLFSLFSNSCFLFVFNTDHCHCCEVIIYCPFDLLVSTNKLPWPVFMCLLAICAFH